MVRFLKLLLWTSYALFVLSALYEVAACIYLYAKHEYLASIDRAITTAFIMAGVMLASGLAALLGARIKELEKAAKLKEPEGH